MAVTPNIGLYKPSRNDSIEVDVSLAQNFEKIDEELTVTKTNVATVTTRVEKSEKDIELLKASGGTGGSGTPAFIDGGNFLDTYASQTSGLDGGAF